MSDNRLLKYGVGYCPICQRGSLALTKDGKLRPHNVMPWIRRKCANRDAHLTKRAADGARAPREIWIDDLPAIIVKYRGA